MFCLLEGERELKSLFICVEVFVGAPVFENVSSVCVLLSTPEVYLQVSLRIQTDVRRRGKFLMTEGHIFVDFVMCFFFFGYRCQSFC